MRVSDADSNVVQLQIAARKFVPLLHKGPAIWLTAVSHIGESNYFAALQRHLDQQTLVLFEGIGEHHARKVAPAGGAPRTSGRPPVPTRTISSKANRTSLQSSMASSLGLAFQLEAIDYSRPNFQNSDLSIYELRQLMAEMRTAAGQEGADQIFENLLKAMEGGSVLDSILQLAMNFLGASPKLQAMSKLVLIETISQMKGDPSELRGLPPQLTQLLEVLIDRRNQKVLADLKSELEEFDNRNTIAIFYGTGHMPDLEMRLRRELNYQPVAQVWFNAFSVNLAETGISSSELDFIRSFVNREMEQFRSPKPSKQTNRQP